MFRSSYRGLEITHKVVDLGLVAVSWWLACYISLERAISFSESADLWYLKAGVLLGVLSYVYFRREGFYTSKRLESLIQEVVRVIKANTITIVVFVLFIYFLTSHKASRVLLINYYIISTISLISFKVLVRKALRSLRRKGKNLRYAIFIGSGRQIVSYAHKVCERKEAGIIIRGWVDSGEAAKNLGVEELSEFSKEVMEKLSPDIVVIGYDGGSLNKIYSVTEILMNSVAETIILPDLSHSLVGYSVSDFYGIPMIKMNQPNIRGRSVIAKRSFDFIFSIIGMIVLSPLFLVIAALIKVSSRGPVFYSQVRVGLDGKEFKMFKFRSMVADSKNHEGWTVQNDSRVTKVGAILRKTSLDEFPQLWNVFLGNMSIVGPRPERPQYVEQFKKDIPTYMLRHKMKAGITGWAQVNGWRGDTSIERRIEYDLYYIRNWSLWLDMSIIFMTFWKGFINKNAY